MARTKHNTTGNGTHKQRLRSYRARYAAELLAQQKAASQKPEASTAEPPVYEVVNG